MTTEAKRMRRLQVHQVMNERKNEMYDVLEDKALKPRVYAKETVIAVGILVLLWMAFIATSILDYMIILADI